MSRKVVAAGAAAAVLAVGAGVGVRESGVVGSDKAPCVKPLTILSSEQADAVRALELYITLNIAPTYKGKTPVDWQSASYAPTVDPNRIELDVAVYQGFGEHMKTYHVVIVRNCQGDDWTVVKFK